MSLLTDTRYALRTFRREPLFVAGVVLTFGLVIGTNAAMFGLVQRLMLAPPPGIQDAERVVRVGLTFASEDGGRFTMTSTSYPVFRSLAAFALRDLNLAKIESRPLRGKPWEYLFYLDFLGHVDDPVSRNALGHLGDDDTPHGVADEDCRVCACQRQEDSNCQEERDA